jgi:hypothetical protein
VKLFSLWESGRVGECDSRFKSQDCVGDLLFFLTPDVNMSVSRRTMIGPDYLVLGFVEPSNAVVSWSTQ